MSRSLALYLKSIVCTATFNKQRDLETDSAAVFEQAKTQVLSVLAQLYFKTKMLDL